METKTEEVLGQGRLLVRTAAEWLGVRRAKTSSRCGLPSSAPRLTDDGCLLLTKEYRVPVGKTVVGFPAGLIGETHGMESESIESAVKRELLEEAGDQPQSVIFLTEGPTSCGQIVEVISIVLAQGLRKVIGGRDRGRKHSGLSGRSRRGTRLA